MANKELPHHVSSISIEDLFGRYSYSMPAENQELNDLNILYGNNGAGKTTLLSLLYHMISPLDKREHRTKIAEIPFSNLIVKLSDGTTIQAKNNSQLLIGPVHFSIQRSGQQKIEWNFSPSNDRNAIQVEDLPDNIIIKKLPMSIRDDVARAIAQRNFHAALGKLEVTTYMLTSDRILMSDSLVTNEMGARSDTRNRARLSEIVADSRVDSVFEAMKSASTWVQRKYLEKNFGGSESSKSLYEGVISRIANTTSKTKTGLNRNQETLVIEELTTMVRDLDKRSKELAKYGLGSSEISPEMAATISATKGNKLNLINSILQPYLAGLTARLNDVYPLYLLVDTFVTQVNKFLRDKKLVYSLRTGFRILVDPVATRSQQIPPAQLSSGEQQLILLFCYVLISRDKPSVFIIDEPEISLNIVWQRMLIGSLRELVNEAEIQFIFASHSMEILSKHKDRVISMSRRVVNELAEMPSKDQDHTASKSWKTS